MVGVPCGTSTLYRIERRCKESGSQPGLLDEGVQRIPRGSTVHISHWSSLVLLFDTHPCVFSVFFVFSVNSD
jgi:hypothetical protein